MSLTGVKKHIRLLEDAGLVSTHKNGRVRECELGTDRLDVLDQWIEQYRQAVEQRLDRFGRLLEQRKGSHE